MSTIVRWDPVRELDSLQGEVNRLFDGFFGSGGPDRARRWIPAIDLMETEEHLLLRADLPGLDREDVSIEVEDSVLTISGERRVEHDGSGEGYHRVERAAGAFARSMRLPEGIDPERIEAGFDRGVLEVRIPKPEQAKPVRVEIGAGSVNGRATEKE